MSDQSMALIKRTLNSTEIMTRFASIMGERDAAYYINSVILAVANSKDLQECTPNSIVFSALRAASLKLSCDPSLGEAWMIPFKNNKEGTVEAAFIIGYKGLRNLATRTNKYRYINAAQLRNGEQWIEDKLTGKCSIAGKPIDNTKLGWFAFFEMYSGYSKGLYMTTEEIHEHARHYSKTYSNPRSKWQSKDRLEVDAMEKKTVLRRLLSHWGDLGEAGNAFKEEEFIDGDLSAPLELHGEEIPPKTYTQAQVMADLYGDPMPTDQDGEPPIPQNETVQPEPTAEPSVQTPPHAWTEDEIYAAVIDAGMAPDLFSAKGALAKCTTGWDTPAKATAWLKVYRLWRAEKLVPDAAAAKANLGEVPPAK